MRRIKQMEEWIVSLREMEWDGYIPPEDIISVPPPMCDEMKRVISQAMTKYKTPEDKLQARKRNAKNSYRKNREKILQKIKDERVWKIRTYTPKPGLRKTYKITYSDGRIETVTGLTMWCKENGYSRGNINQVIYGKRKRHKDVVAVEKLVVPS